MFEPVLGSEETLLEFTRTANAALVWFAGPGCGVCDALGPRVGQLLREEFTHMAAAGVDCAATPAVAASRQVFSVPTAIVYFEGTETFRLARNFSVGELRAALQRPYAMLFGTGTA